MRWFVCSAFVVYQALGCSTARLDRGSNATHVSAVAALGGDAAAGQDASADAGGAGAGGGGASGGSTDAGGAGAGSGGVGGQGGAGGAGGQCGGRAGAGGQGSCEKCAVKLHADEQGHITGPAEIKQGRSSRYGIANGSVKGGCGKCGKRKCHESSQCKWSISDPKKATVTANGCNATVNALDPGNVALSVQIVIECDTKPASDMCKSKSDPVSFSKPININR